MQITIATRTSDLALWQANYIKSLLLQQNPSLEVKLLPIVTKGDIKLDTSLAKIGGKGLFIKELERALIAKKADLAVHSAKDLPDSMPVGLEIGAVCGKSNNTDCLLANQNYKQLSELPLGAVIGTSSPRRTTQLLNLRPDLKIKLLRGNITTRIKKLEQGLFDAIILATCGVTRLKLAQKIAFEFAPAQILPAAGQGVLALQLRKEDLMLQNMIAKLNDANAFACLKLERELLKHLGASCHAAIGAVASYKNQSFELQAVIGNINNNNLIKVRSSHRDYQYLAKAVAASIENQGGKSWLQ